MFVHEEDKPLCSGTVRPFHFSLDTPCRRCPSNSFPISHAQGIAVLFEPYRVFDEHTLAHQVLAHSERNMQRMGHRVGACMGMDVATSVALADVYCRASTLLTNMTYTPSWPHATPALRLPPHETLYLSLRGPVRCIDEPHRDKANMVCAPHPPDDVL